nr:hypothetical protein [Nannocystis pusilla]
MDLLLATTIRVPLASGSPVPRLRTKRGCAPLATWTRSRCPRGKRYAVGHSSTGTRSTPSASFSTRPGVNRSSPSHTLSDRPEGWTSHRRTNTSVHCVLDEKNTSARTGPTTSRSRSSGALVYVHTSARASSARLSCAPASRPSSTPPTLGVGSAGS